MIQGKRCNMGKEMTEAKYGNAFTSALIACALFCAMVPSAHSAEVSKDDAWVAGQLCLS